MSYLRASLHFPQARQQSRRMSAASARSRGMPLMDVTFGGYSASATRRHGPTNSSRHLAVPIWRRCERMNVLTSARTLAASGKVLISLIMASPRKNTTHRSVPTLAHHVCESVPTAAAKCRAKSRRAHLDSSVINRSTAHAHASGSATTTTNPITSTICRTPPQRVCEGRSLRGEVRVGSGPQFMGA